MINKPLPEFLKENNLAQLEGVLTEMAEPCIYGSLSAVESSRGKSKIGGVPDMAEHFIWPVHKDKPLTFVAQINLSEIKHELLPNEGMLYFFYDLEAWGFDPDDAGFIKVIYENSLAELQPVRLPEMEVPVLFGLKTKKLTPHTFQERRIKFYNGYSIPSSEDKRLAKFLEDDKVCDAYCDAKEKLTPTVQMFGYPNPVQGDMMQMECQLVTHGIYCGDASGYEKPRALELAPGQDDWVLLFQLGEDPETDMLWGDAGFIYYWIRRQDLQDGHFHKAWLILQCC